MVLNRLASDVMVMVVCMLTPTLGSCADHSDCCVVHRAPCTVLYFQQAEGMPELLNDNIESLNVVIEPRCTGSSSCGDHGECVQDNVCKCNDGYVGQFPSAFVSVAASVCVPVRLSRSPDLPPSRHLARPSSLHTPRTRA